jgi:hypothetical protein
MGITAELEGVYGHETLSLSTGKKWRRRFVNGRITLEDNFRSGKPPWSDLCEFLPVLMDETPFISCKRMCQKPRMAKTTRLRVLQQDLGFRKCYSKWVTHSVTKNEALCQFMFSEEFLSVMCHAKETSFEHLLSGDEPWFCSEHPHDSAWAREKVTLPNREAQKIQTKGCLVSITVPFEMNGRSPSRSAGR